MKWLRTLALLSSLLCVWQLTEGRPPAIPPRHLFNNVQSSGGSSFIDKAKIMYSQRHLQNRIQHKENPPPRQFSNTVLRRRFNANTKPQFNLQKQSPRALPLISSLRHNQEHAFSSNAPTLGDAIIGLMSGSIEGHINNDLKQIYPGTPSSTTNVPIVDIAMDFGHPVTSHSENNQDRSSPVTTNNSNSKFSHRNIAQDSNPINEVNNFGNANSHSSQNQDNIPSTMQDKTIILASPDYSDYSGSPDYSNVAATSPDYGFPEPNYPPGFPDYSDSIVIQSNNPTGQASNDFNIPDSGFPEPNYPPGFPDYSDSSAPISNSPSGQGSNDFNIPDSGFPEPNYPPGFPDYSDSSAPNSNSPAGQGPNDFSIPDSGFPEPNYPPDFPDYSSSIGSGTGSTKSIAASPNSNSNSPDYNAPSVQSWDEFNQGYDAADPIYTFPSSDNNGPSPDYNSHSPDYNAPSSDYNSPSQDYNNGPQTFGSSDYSSPDYAQASSPSVDYNLDIPNNESPAKTIRTQQDLFDLVKIAILDRLTGGGGNIGGGGNRGEGGNNGGVVNNVGGGNRGGDGNNGRGGNNVGERNNGGGRNNEGGRNNGGRTNSPKSISPTPGRQNNPFNNPESGNPLDQIFSFGQGVVDAASGTGRELFGTGQQIIGVAQENIGQTVDAVSKVIDDISRELLRSIQLIHGELKFLANDKLQIALEAFQKTVEVAQNVGGDFYRASLQVRDLFGRFISEFIENVSRFVGTAVNRSVDGAVKQAVSTGQFIGNLKTELLRSIVDNGNAAQQMVQRGLEDTGNFMAGMGGVTTRFTSSATRTIG